MPEAITKYAINSTLGTDDFRPLDIYMRDLFIKMKRLVAQPESSGNLLFSKTTVNPSDNNNYIKLNGKYYIGEFSSYIGGEIFLRFIPQGATDLFHYLKFAVYKDDVFIASYQWETKTLTDGTIQYQFSGNLKIEPLSIYKFYIEGAYEDASGAMSLGNVVSYGYASVEDWHSYDFDFEDKFIEEETNA